jgi:DNA-binding YbaB/EbfC family protein
MAGVGKLLKQAQKMQKRMEAIQEELAQRELDISSGGGAVRISITGQGEFKKITLDPEFLREDVQLVEETLLTAVQEAVSAAKALSEDEMGKASGGLNLPGLF